MLSFDLEVADEVTDLHSRFMAVQGENAVKGKYYDGLQRIKDLGISLPPQMRSIDTVVGWPGTTVDVMEERLDFEGWTGDDLDEVYRENRLSVEAPQAHLDALIYGTSFVAVSTGGDGEPDPLITVESPTSMTAKWDGRRRAISSAAKFWTEKDGAIEADHAILFRRNETVTLEKYPGGWRAVDVDEHGLGRVPVAQMVNRPRASKGGGRSEITPAVRSATDSALRTLVGAEVAREFYSVPQRYLLGAPEDFFIDPDTGEPRGAWDAVMGKVMGVPRDENDELPQVGSFAAHAMTPFFEQVRTYAQILSAETAIPPMYLGFTSDQASSADAIRSMEIRLVKRAERRQAMFGNAWTEAGRLAVMMRDGLAYEDLPVEVLEARPMWRDPSTPTVAASADATVKGIQAGVFAPRGELTLRRLNLNPAEREMVRRDWAADSSGAIARLAEFSPSSEALELVRGGPGSNDGVQDVSGDSSDDSGAISGGGVDQMEEARVLKAKADAMGVLIRAGVENGDAARIAGIDGVKFVDGRPVTLRFADEK